MKKLFSKEIYKQNLKNLSLTGLLTAVLCILVTLLLISSDFGRRYFNNRIMSDYMIIFRASNYTAIGIMPILLAVMFIAAPMFTYLVFRYQNKRALSDKHHSLPYTSTQQFVSGVSAVLTMVFAIILVTMITALTAIWVSGANFILSYVFLSAIGYMAGSALVCAVVALAMSFTGNLFANFTVSAVILLLPRCILYIIGVTNRLVSSGFVPVSEQGIFLDPSTNIPVGLLLDALRMYEYNGMSGILISAKSMIYTFVLAILYFGIALFLTNRRKSELAGKSFANNTLGYVFAALCAAPFLADSAHNTIGGYFYSEVSASIILRGISTLIIASVILFLVISLIYNGRYKQSLKGIAIFAAVAVLTFAAIGIGYFNTEKQINKKIDPEDVAYMKIDLSPLRDYEAVPVYTYGMLCAKDIKIYDHKIIECMTAEMDYASEQISSKKDDINGLRSYGNMWCEFYLDNGQKIVRYIPFYRDPFYSDYLKREIRDLLINNQEFYDALISLPTVDEIDEYSVVRLPLENTPESDAIFESLMDELNNAAPESRKVLPYYIQSQQPNLGSVGSVYIDGRKDGIAFRNTLEINSSVPETKNLYMETVSNYKDEEFNTMLDIVLSDKMEEYNLSFRVILNGMNYNYDERKKEFYYETFSPDDSIKKEIVFELAEEFKDVDYSDLYNYENYAIVCINMNAVNIENAYKSTDTFVPLSDELYSRCYEIFMEQYEN